MAVIKRKVFGSRVLKASVFSSLELTVSRLLEIDVGIAQRAPGSHIPTHADGKDIADRGEHLIEHRFSHVGVQIAHIERGE